MKIGLVNAIGLNSADAMLEMELCLLLQDEGLEVVPIVQSEIGSAAIVSKDFPYRIADMTTEEDAADALSDIDVVVFLKEATPNAPHGQPKVAREVNQKVVDNLVKYSKRSSSIIYISSISAYGGKLADKYQQDLLVREKRFIEKRVKKKCAIWNRKYKNQKRAYILRIGHVMGMMQKQTNDLERLLEKGGRIYIDADGNLESNVAHIMTVIGAILMCQNEEIKPGKYTVVNSPQWSWKEVIEYYAPEGTKIQFYGSKSGGKKSIKNNTMSMVWKIAESQKSRLVPLLTHMSEERNIQVINKHLRGESKEAINNLKRKVGIRLDIFSYNPAPGKVPEIELEGPLQKYEKATGKRK
ncbi:MAG: NAD-dependent epimerase/dehydratase family protein [Halobacteriales archaeon]